MARVCGSRRNFVEFLGVNLEWRIPTSASSAADASFFEFFSMLEARGKGEASPQSFFSPKCPYDFLQFELCPPLLSTTNSKPRFVPSFLVVFI